MMNRLLTIAGAFLLLAACQENDIEVYAESPRIGFENRSSLGGIPESYVFFTDEDYIDRILSRKDSVRLEVMGTALPGPGICCFREVEEEGREKPEVKFPSQILLDSGAYSAYLHYTVMRPVKPGQEYVQRIALDTERKEHSFDPGRREGAEIRIIASFQLKPVAWNNYFGAYSDGKYLFMMDCFGATYSSIGNTSENRRVLREAYADHRVSEGPVQDENGNEIIFP